MVILVIFDYPFCVKILLLFLFISSIRACFCARYGGDEFVVMYENISKEDAKEYVEELRRKVMELTLPHRFSKMLPIVTITQGMYCDVPKEENRVWDFLHVADEILYSVKTDNRGSCRVVDRAEFKLMSGYGTTIQGQA